MTEPLKAPYMPTMDEAVRFMQSNPQTSWEILIEIFQIGDEEKAAVSGGRMRELWKLSGGAFDKKGRAWVEIDTLPFVLRRLIDSVNKIDSQ